MSDKEIIHNNEEIIIKRKRKRKSNKEIRYVVFYIIKKGNQLHYSEPYKQKENADLFVDRIKSNGNIKSSKVIKIEI